MPDSAQVGKNEHEEAFLAAVLRQSCFLKCNPSSLYQTLVFGADNNDRHLQEMQLAKQDCVRGCSLASNVASCAADLATYAKLAEAGDEKLHREVLSKEMKADVIREQDRICAELKTACASECMRRCKETDAHREIPCSSGCIRGCKLFIDSLRYDN
mmetsp:Transcript_18486/g.36276  ORF Transcript_18486/g.36276 Transcript_18486/m.36276 type:complete len:157 (+) Transcript_18486:312-782(+)|eukprot:CAMPEP_0171492252 /NCGR_PEP_ID=MMETSP0958-20121227/4308_1 /TAXON_ID=87120 /ORGANISM="Aurantiochytrium limacinum, Strain ATCCMYA-1381" /LENGTH=156 /DNA_ID=CAMNT_0012025753 /DNA_START=135 /DNA_END=605 /DNA_ORIENTATION=+